MTTGQEQQIARGVAFESARLRLARVRLSCGETRDAGLRLIAQVVAEAVRVERVGVWLFEDGGRGLRCHAQYRLTDGRFEAGQLLESRHYPRYLAELQQRRALVADDARTHLVTSELATRYLVPNSIVSMLDAPIIRDGRVVGVICHESPVPRRWLQTEVDFAGSAGDLVALLMEQAARIELEAALKLRSQNRMESQKMEALGRMGRAVGHDLNNLLMVVLSTSEEARRSDCPTCVADAEILRNAAEVGQRLVKRLFEVGGGSSGPGPTTLEPVAADEVLRDLVPGLRALAGHDIEVTVDVRTGARVRLPQDELEQVILNLVVNARDAINAVNHRNPGIAHPSGRLTVSLWEPRPDERMPPGRVVLEVSDTGSGMDASTQAHVFEPYFTTKPEGSGLGLSIVYGIVKRAGGAIDVASAPGVGSTFRVMLLRDPPAEDGEPSPSHH
jgi:two-component system, cell cycle sensor histidine kinase and response regulator CckA